MSLVIFASELAACVGMNKYKSVEDAKMDVWRRWDAPSFHRASSVKSPEEVYSSLRPGVQKLVSRAVSREIFFIGRSGSGSGRPDLEPNTGRGNEQ